MNGFGLQTKRNKTTATYMYLSIVRCHPSESESEIWCDQSFIGNEVFCSWNRLSPGTLLRNGIMYMTNAGCLLLVHVLLFQLTCSNSCGFLRIISKKRRRSFSCDNKCKKVYIILKVRLKWSGTIKFFIINLLII